VTIEGEPINAAEGRILSGRMDEYNDFGNSPLEVKPFTDFEIREGMLTLKMPACSVAEIRI